MNAIIKEVLTATGYMLDGEPVSGLLLEGEAQSARRPGAVFTPDALWRSKSALKVYFKLEQNPPTDRQVSQWRQEIWNEGFAPLLWVVSPERIDLYNGFGVPLKEEEDAKKHLLHTFENVKSQLRKLDNLAGRLAMETGQFWAQEPAVDRKTAVDRKLLSDLARLEKDLVAEDLMLGAAQALIGRIIFIQYLVDRKIVSPTKLKGLCGYNTLPEVLRHKSATTKLFKWLTETFNGDMFPDDLAGQSPSAKQLSRAANFLDAVDESGQGSLFPYQFNVIPVELISSIYEQFAHASGEGGKRDVHYTRLSLVSLVLDEVMDGMTGDETVLDLTCGSGVFLVEALRRLVKLKRPHGDADRQLIRETLYKQIYGVDISEAAIRVAAFSLYLAALELDPNPQPPHALKFKPLVGKNLQVGDAHTIDLRQQHFDLIVGNPPWSFKGHQGTTERRESRDVGVPAQPRGQALDFLFRAKDFSHEKTRYGIVLSAMSFFGRSGTAVEAMVNTIRNFAPITLVNLSNLKGWLFATAQEPAMVLYARHRPQSRKDIVTIVQVPWTPDSAKTHSFEISPNDISAVSIDDIASNPIKLKAVAVGRYRDNILLDELTARYEPLGDQIQRLHTQFRLGLIRGKQDRDAGELRGLGLLQNERHFYIPDALPPFQDRQAERPRDRDIYRTPLLVVKSMMAGRFTRSQVAVSDRDIVFTDAYYGASFSSLPDGRQVAGLLATILSSALSSWFFYLTASECGVRKPRLLEPDLCCLPVPELRATVNSRTGKKLLRIEEELRNRGADTPISARQWNKLDEAVFDLYGLQEQDKIIVRDGLFRAESYWNKGHVASAAPADCRPHLMDYAEAFLSVIRGWFSARNARGMRAEIIDLPENAALRVVRFVLEDAPGNFNVKVVDADGDLNEILAGIGKRLKVKVARELSIQRELHVHGRDEVVIIKPAARRYWLGVKALEDADKVIADSFTGGRA